MPLFKFLSRPPNNWGSATGIGFALARASAYASGSGSGLAIGSAFVVY